MTKEILFDERIFFSKNNKPMADGGMTILWCGVAGVAVYDKEENSEFTLVWKLTTASVCCKLWI